VSGDPIKKYIKLETHILLRDTLTRSISLCGK